MASTTVMLTTAALLCGIVTFSGRRLRAKFIRHYLCLEELTRLGAPRSGKIKGTAVVCGGSLGGLLAARVCHDHFQRVVIVEPEAWVSTEQGKITHAWQQKERRSRVVQYQSFQAMQVFSLYVLEKLFPNFDAECKASDISNLAADLKAIVGGWALLRLPYDEYNGDLPKATYASRQGLETLLRRLVVNKDVYPNIEQLTGTAAGVVPNPSDHSQIQKVTVRTSDGEIFIDAVLVVDCTGSTQAGYKWLTQAGYGLADHYPKSTLPIGDLKITYDPKMHYSTFQFYITPDLARRLPIPGGFDDNTGAILCVFCAKDPKHTYAWKRDGNIVQVAAGRWGDGPMPGTVDEMIEYTKSMEVAVPLPQWYYEFLDMLKDEAEEFIPCSKVRVVPSSCVQYQRAINLPSNFVALGDAVTRINPIGGHGISKMMMGICVLDDTLRSLPLACVAIPSNFSRKFFKAQFNKIGPIWNMIKTGDYARPSTVPSEGETLEKGAWGRWYAGKISLLRTMDNEVGSAAFHVSNYLSPRTDFLHPKIFAKVMWHVLKQKLT